MVDSPWAAQGFGDTELAQAGNSLLAFPGAQGKPWYQSTAFVIVNAVWPV